MKGNNSKDSALSPELEHDMFINLTSSTEEKFLPYQFKLPRVSGKQYPRKNRFRFQYSMGKSRIYENTNSPSSNLNHSCNMSIRIFSRSAKIMRALSSPCNLFRNDVGSDIRKLLNFDSTPSPKENSSYENSSSSINTDTSPSILNSSLTDSSDSNVPTVESIDENQNQTPQQTRKHIKGLRNDVKRNIYNLEPTLIQPRTSYLMSMLEKKQKEETDKDTNHRISLHPFCSFNPFNNGSSRIITASTPRNLSQEFDQEMHDRPHTPVNVIDIIPESISAIKKSHKKEKLYCHEEQSTRPIDVSEKKDDLHPITAKALETDVLAESIASESESQKKNRNTKRTLIYNVDNKCSDIRSDFDCNLEQKTTSMGIDLLEIEVDQIKSDETQNIDSNDYESLEENMHVSIHLTNDNDEGKEEENRFKNNVCNEEVNQLSLQKESSSISNVNVSENRMASPESNPSISQDTNKVVTPENDVNVLKHVLTESIKKSHKKMKHGNRRKLFKTKNINQEMELEKSKTSLEDACNDDQDIKTINTICISSPPNFEFDRPNTPENVNSSRLLLLDFNSVKKSHKKDKRSKRTCSFVACHDYEYRKRSNDSLQSSRNEEENRISCRNESLEVKESPGMPKKKKKPISMSLQSSTPKKMSSAFMSLGYKNIDDEFKIYTPIKKRPILLTVTDYVTDEIQDKDEPVPAISNEIDCSRCSTPIARFKELKKNKLASEHDNATGFEADINVLETFGTENLKDKNGRSTPINMSTTELLYNIDSIKKSHKKDKHSRSRRSSTSATSEKKRLYNQESEHINFTNCEKMMEECNRSIALKHDIDNHCTEKKKCSIMYKKEKDNSYRETDYDNSQPSTSRGGDNIENVKKTTVSKFLNTTPPNSLIATNFIKLLHTTSIKKSHKKERDMKAQTKYIFMSQEHELSDDGSIFDEEDKLNFMDLNDNNTEITTM